MATSIVRCDAAHHQKLIDLSGQTFGRLFVISLYGFKITGHMKSRDYIYLCSCICGSGFVLAKAKRLREGSISSCGCKLRKHGHCGKDSEPSSKTYLSWENMRARCANPNNPHFRRYGGAGVKVCERWQDFSTFLQDMGERPEGTTLDRIDNNKGYSPDNCRWATKKQQQRNLRNNRYVSFNGQRKLLVEWSEELGLRPNTIWYRYKRGWPIDVPMRNESR